MIIGLNDDGSYVASGCGCCEYSLKNGDAQVEGELQDLINMYNIIKEQAIKDGFGYLYES